MVALVRKGNSAAFEALVARYESRLLAFCRHMLNSREDAEDVLQEVFAAAYNAILGDNRAINVRPWLYRIARNRSLNHLRKHTAIGVDSMDVHIADGGQTTAEKVHEREEFRALIVDVQELPETQRTALLLREIDALSYEQIAEAMETTVPSVKSLLVRARVSLAEMSEARELTCEQVREELGEVAEGLCRTSAPVRRHLRRCDRCTNFRKQLRETNKALAAVMPVGPLLLLKKVILAHLGTTASASTAATATATTAAATTAASAGSAGLLSATVSTVASKAAAGITAAAIVAAGAVEVKRARVPESHPPAAIAQAATPPAPAPAVAKTVSADVEARALAERRAVAAAADRAARQERIAAAAAKAEAEAAKATQAAATPPVDPAAAAGAEEAPAVPTGPTEQGVDTTVLPAEDGTGGITAPPNEEPPPPLPAQQQPQQQPAQSQPQQQGEAQGEPEAQQAPAEDEPPAEDPDSGEPAPGVGPVPPPQP